ncbi:L domain-like protein, partial [Rhizoclosmatium globosum]
MDSLLNELKLLILLWIPQPRVFKYRRLSRAFNYIITSKQFILKSRAIHSKPDLTIEEKNWCISRWFAMPPASQSGYAAAILSYRSNLELSFHQKASAFRPIPSSIGQLTDLTSLILEGCILKGPIPLELFTLTNLETIKFDHNELIGTISPLIGNLVNLRFLSFYQNHLVSGVPTEISQCSKLEYLNVSYNFLTETIPDSIGQLSCLHTLSFHFQTVEDYVVVRQLPLIPALSQLTSLKVFHCNNPDDVEAIRKYLPNFNMEYDNLSF